MKSLPNHLTISRFWMTAVMMVCMTLDFPYARMAALAIFIIASITDALDGYLARNFFGCTSFGKLMDPLADKVLVCAAFIGFVELDSLRAWMVVLIAESTGVGYGLGQVIMLARNTFNPSLVFFCIALIGFLGFATDWAMRMTQKRVLYWVNDPSGVLRGL